MISFILGAIFGGLIEMIIQHPFEELVEEKFQQILHIGVYRKLYFKTVDFEFLKKRMVEALDNYDFDYAKILLKQMEWFIKEKTLEERREAREEADKDFKDDLANIGEFKGDSSPYKYKEDINKWIKKDDAKTS